MFDELQDYISICAAMRSPYWYEEEDPTLYDEWEFMEFS